jgi:hypothetical protein
MGSVVVSVTPFSITLSRLPVTPIDGVWYDPVTKSIAHLDSGTFLAYSLSMSTPSYFFGLFTLSGTNVINAEMVASNGPPVNQMFSGTYTLGTAPVTLSTTINNVTTTYSQKLAADPKTDGVWAGISIGAGGAYCLSVVQFTSTLFRAYTTSCDNGFDGGFGTYLGLFAYNEPDSQFNITYTYVANAKYPMANLILPGTTQSSMLTFSNMDQQITLVNGPVTTQLFKTTGPPAQVRAELTLTGDFASFGSTEQTAVVNALATLLDVDVKLIRVIGTRSGSIIVTLQMDDDSVSGTLASTAYLTLAGSSMVGTYPVAGVLNVTPGSGASVVPSIYIFIGLLCCLIITRMF